MAEVTRDVPNKKNKNNALPGVKEEQSRSSKGKVITVDARTTARFTPNSEVPSKTDSDDKPLSTGVSDITRKDADETGPRDKRVTAADERPEGEESLDRIELRNTSKNPRRTDTSPKESSPVDPVMNRVNVTEINNQIESMLMTKAGVISADSVSAQVRSSALVQAYTQEDVINTMLSQTGTLEVTYGTAQTMNPINMRGIFNFISISELSEASQKGLWTVVKGVPSFFHLEPITDFTLDTMLERYSATLLDDVPQIAQSMALARVGTPGVVYTLKYPSFYSHVPNPNVPDIDTIIPVERITQSNVDETITLRKAQSRFKALLRLMFSPLPVFRSPKRLVVSADITNPAVEDGLQLPIYQYIRARPAMDDNPHIYLSAYHHRSAWYERLINQMAMEYPMLLGPENPDFVAGIEVSKIWHVVTDQFMSRLSFIGWQTVRNRKLTDYEITAMIQAMIDAQATVRITEPMNPELRFVYSPTDAERRGLMYGWFLSNALRQSYTCTIIKELVLCGQITTTPVGQTLKNLAVGQTNANSGIVAKLISAAANVSTESIAAWLAVETNPSLLTIRLDVSPMSYAFSDLISLFATLLWFVVSPKIAKRIATTLIYHIFSILISFGLVAEDVYVATHGWIGIMTDHGFQPLENTTRRILRQTELERGYTVSFLALPPAAFNYHPILPRLRALIEPMVVPLHLHRKREAQFPYFRTNYVAYQSWEADPDFNDGSIVTSQLMGRLASLVDFCDLVATRYTQGATRRNTTPADVTIWNEIKQILRGTTYDAALALSATCAGLQDVILNSCFTVYDDYDLTWNFSYPQLVGIGTPFIQEGGRVLSGIDCPQDVQTMPHYLPLSLFFCLTGKNGRTPDVRSMLSGVAGAEARPRREAFSVFHLAKALPNWLNSVEYTSVLLDSLTVLGAIYDRQHPFVELREFGEFLRPYSTMRGFLYLFKTIKQETGIEFPDVLLKLETSMRSNQAADIRTYATTIVILNRDLTYDMQRQPQNTIFGDRIDQFSDRRAQLVEVASKLTLAQNSPAVLHGKGLFIGMCSQDNYSAQAGYDGDKFNRIIDYVYGHTFRFAQSANGGQNLALFLEDDDGEEELIFDPFDHRVAGTVIRVQHFGQIRELDVNWIARGMTAGNIGVLATEQWYNYSVKYIPFPMTDGFREDAYAYFKTFLLTPIDGWVDVEFLESSWTSAFNQRPIDTYPAVVYQYAFALHPINKEYVCGPMGDLLAAPPGYRPPPPEMFEYGTRRGDIMYNHHGIPKINSFLPNFNNDLATVNDGERYQYWPKHEIIVG